MPRDALRTPDGWRMYDQANLLILVLLAMAFGLALLGGRISARTAGDHPSATAATTVTTASLSASRPASASASVASASAAADASAPTPSPLAAPKPAIDRTAVDGATAPASIPALAGPAENVASSNAGATPGPGVAAASPSVSSGPALPAPVAALCRAMTTGLAGGFQPGRPELDAQGRRRLRQLLPCLTATRYEVVVHTDSGGNASANDALTLARAQAVVDELVRLGLPAERLQARGAGSREPIGSNDTARGRQANRRLTLAPL